METRQFDLETHPLQSNVFPRSPGTHSNKPSVKIKKVSPRRFFSFLFSLLVLLVQVACWGSGMVFHKTRTKSFCVFCFFFSRAPPSGSIVWERQKRKTVHSSSTFAFNPLSSAWHILWDCSLRWVLLPTCVLSFQPVISLFPLRQRNWRHLLPARS